MAKRKTAPKPEQNDGHELFEALALLEAERGIPADFMTDRIKKAIVTACKNTYGTEEVDVEMDPAADKFEVYLHVDIVEEVNEPGHEILLETAREADPEAEVGGFLRRRLDTKQFGRVAAQTARNIIRQGIRDSEREQMMDEFKTRHQELVSALVERVDPRTGALSLRIGKAEAVLPKGEQIGNDHMISLRLIPTGEGIHLFFPARIAVQDESPPVAVGIRLDLRDSRYFRRIKLRGGKRIAVWSHSLERSAFRCGKPFFGRVQRQLAVHLNVRGLHLRGVALICDPLEGVQSAHKGGNERCAHKKIHQNNVQDG